MIKTRPQTSKQYGHPYDLQTPPTDSTPQPYRQLPVTQSSYSTNLHQPPRAKDGRRASAAEDRILNT
ncbi:unnamed protein product [Aspergillus oryzae]|uniref:Unnamed protein product n=1 Tax=Aspergillus oryzae TaxID=5062 RepID=A0AAN4YWA5_ASPOZ|nr:unnamed protein product [Aspergillus oryzae]